MASQGGGGRSLQKSQEGVSQERERGDPPPRDFLGDPPSGIVNDPPPPPYEAPFTVKKGPFSMKMPFVLKPGCLQLLCGSALFVSFCTLLCSFPVFSFACFRVLLCSFALFCARLLVSASDCVQNDRVWPKVWELQRRQLNP